MAGKIATAYVQVMPSMDGVKSNLEQQFGAEGNRSGSFFGSSLIKTAIGAISVAKIGQALGKTLTEGAALEQSLGGVETLFKENADAVVASAYQAYETAGLSANAYMEQVTSFSASLLQSLSGDTAQAASVADMALTDMSDNANKFGSDMEAITNAYQGFAKQNYTMLDNLKLGYGGTKSEMQRLLKEAQALTGVKYNIDNLSDVYNAIHAIQEDLHISGLTAAEAADAVAKGLMTEKEALEAMGTTAKEASTTLTGSANAMKAAFSNVLGNLALGRELEPSLNALASTTGTFLTGNLVPAVLNIVKALPGAAGTLLSTMLPENMVDVASSMITGLSQGLDSAIPSFLGKTLPILTDFSANLRADAGILFDSGLNLITSLGQGIINAIPEIVSNVPQIVTNFCGIINDNAPKALLAGGKLLLSLGKGILTAGPTILASIPQIVESIMAVFSASNWLKTGSGIIKAIWNGAKKASPTNVLKIGNDFLDSLTEYFETAAPQLLAQGGSLIKNMVTGIWTGLPTLLSSFSSIFANVGALLKDIMPTLISYGSQLLSNLVIGIQSLIPNLLSTAGSLMRSLLETILSGIPAFLSAAASLAGNIGSGIISNLPVILSAGAAVVSSLLGTIASYLPELLEQGISLIGSLVAGLISMIPDVVGAAGDIAADLIDVVKGVDWIALGSDIITGIVSGIWNAASSLLGAMASLAKQALQKAKDVLDINSPSHVFEKEVGMSIPEGTAVGVRKGMGHVRNALGELYDTATTTAASALKFRSSGNSGTPKPAKPVQPIQIVQNIYSKAQTAADLMQEARYQAEMAVLLGA